MTGPNTIPGYTYGTSSVSKSPLTLADLDLMRKTVLLGEDDVRWLRRSRELLAPQVEAILDVWYGFVGSNPFLLASFTGKDGKPDGAYLAAVRKRFGRWILDTADAKLDQAWLDWMNELGKRHHREGKNKTDGAAAADHVPFRYLALLAYPITATLRPFLAQKGVAPADVDAMQQAWLKSVLLQVSLWSFPYVKPGDF